eukprot:gene3320-5759_t
MNYDTYSSYFPGLDKVNSIRLHADDPFIVLASCIAFFLLRKVLNYIAFVPLADYLKLDKSRTNMQKNSKHGRFVEDIWYSIFYPMSTLSMFLILQDKEWFWNPYLSVKGYGLYPHPHIEDSIPMLRLLYLVQFGYYLQLLVTLVFIDEKLNDFYEMLTHHIITKCLIAFSYVGIFHRSGANIILLHDFVDIFLYWAKTCHDADWQLGANVNFFSFVLSLAYVRLYVLARFFITPAFSEPIITKAFYIVRDTAEPFFTIGQYVCIGENCFSIGHVAYGLLIGLWLLHWNWFFRAVHVLVAALKNSGNVEGDSRYEADDKEMQVVN